jgi:hypothetical protein
MNVAIQRAADINIARDFTDAPGPRKRSEGDHSGEEFLDILLRPGFLAARQAHGVLHVNFDGAVGYPTSFLEEAFGGLAREFGSDEVNRILDLICTDEPYLEEQIRRYIREANVTK